VHGLIPAEAASDWSLSGSIMTFAIPVGLFIVVAAILFYLYSRPPVAPGHSDVVPGGGLVARPSAGAAGQPGVEPAAPAPQAAQETPAPQAAQETQETPTESTEAGE
jgi:hypothetical protein